ncbi:extracellular solute-binding protein [bacterium]|jgi:spermidine/putrescine transport system substrate-binding protein|nr:extracellular solute-binding protein [bacterium]
MKHLLLLLTLALTLFGAQKELIVYNWSEYMPDSVIEAFEKESGIKVRYSTYDSNEAMYAKIKTAGAESYDILVPSTYFVNKMSKEGLLAKIDKSKLKNYANLDPRLLGKAYDPKNEYSVPYLWGSTGISYNAKILGEGAVTAWEDLWKKEYKGKILLTDDLREVFGMALMTLGYSSNSTKKEEITAAYEKLKLLMPSVKVFNSESPKQVYMSEEVVVGMDFNGENYMANEEMPELRYVYPKEGIMVWVDSLVIPKNAKNMDNALAFIDFLLRPEISKAISEEVGYASPNRETMKLLDKKTRENRIIYPNEEDLKKSEFQIDVGKSITIYEHYWEKLKTGN